MLIYCSEGSPETFNPQLSTSGTTFDASSRTLYNRLVEFIPGTTNIKPALASRWSVSKNGKEFTFFLRKDVEFHSNKLFTPSRPLNADDVLFSFNRQRLPDHPFHNISNLRFGYFNSMALDKLIEDIIKIDEYTVKFKLSRSESPFLATLAMDFASILSAEYAQNLLANNTPQHIDNQPIGTGPFQLIRYQPDAYIRFRAHQEYWQGKPELENLVFAITPDPSLRFARMIAGECDVMANPLPVHIDVASSHKNLKVLSDPGLNVAYLSLNTRKAPFNNLKVRQAINLAIDKKSIISTVYQNTATVAKSPIPPSIWSYDPRLQDYGFNLATAKRLMQEAGYEQGFDMQIWTMSAQRAYNPNAKKMAELIQQDLRQLNINVSISTFEFGTFLYNTRRGQHHAALMGWISDNGDPDNFFSPLLSCSATISGTNSAFWCDPNFDQLIDIARALTLKEDRIQLYKKAQQVFINNAPWVPIAHSTQHSIINKRVENFQIIPAGGVYFGGVTLKALQASQEIEELSSDD
ncbi:ABC transporter substrate-binding protein [Aliikangiella sp. IMCC44632]